MKILILFAGDRNSLGWSYGRAFKSLGHEITVLNPMDSLGSWRLWTHRVSRRLLERQILYRFSRSFLPKLLEAGTFDVVFVGKGAWALPQLWKGYKAARPETTLVCYNADDPITTWSRGGNRPWVTEAIPAYDLYITYNESLVEPIRQAGARSVLRLPFAWDPSIHPMQNFDDSADIVFVGNSDAYREEWLTALVEHPLAADWRIHVYGRWHQVRSTALRRAIQPVQKTGAEMARLTAGARVAINILRRQNEGSHNMRTFETPGCGGILASQLSAEQDTVFPDGQAAIYFRTPQEMAPRLAPFIGDLERLAAMRTDARARVAGETYLDRARVLLGTLEEMRLTAVTGPKGIRHSHGPSV